MKVFCSGTLLFLLILVSCSKTNQPDIGNLAKQPIPLNEESLRLQEDDVHKPFVRIQAIDTFLILSRRNEPYIKIYGLNSLHPIAALGYRGEGIDEFSEAPSFVKDSSPTTNGGKERLVVYDFGKSRLGYLDLTTIPTDESSFDWLRVTAPASWGYIDNIYGLSENTLLAMSEVFSIDMPRASKFSVLNMETGDGFHIPISNQPEVSINENILGTVFLSNAGIQPDLGLMVAVPWYFPRLDFYDLKGQYVYSTTYDDPNKNKDVYLEGISEASRTNALKRYKGASYSIYFDLDLIIIWSYQSPIDRSKNWEKVEVLLRVFDWEGNHLETFSIQANSNSSFTFDKINNRFIVYDSSDDDNNLKAFNIPSVQ